MEIVYSGVVARGGLLEQSFVGGLAAEAAVRPMVVAEVLPFLEAVVEQLGVVDDHAGEAGRLSSTEQPTFIERNVSNFPVMQELSDRCRATAAEQLDADPFAVTHLRGRALPLDDGVILAAAP